MIINNWLATLLLGLATATCFMSAFLLLYNARAENFDAATFYTLWFVILAWFIQGECKKINAPTGETP
jgi:hypothetical protein